MRRASDIAKLLARAEAFIDQATLSKLLQSASIESHAIRLEVPGRQLVIPVESKPSKIFDDSVVRSGNGACLVEIFDAEDYLATCRPHLQPCKQKRSRIAEMEIAGWAGCETAGHGGSQ